MRVDAEGEPADGLGVAARVELAFDRQLERGEMQFLQAPRLRGRERLLAHPRQGRVPPQRERLLGELAAPTVRFVRGLLDELFEAQRVDCGRSTCSA